jgi:hypothetical protein
VGLVGKFVLPTPVPEAAEEQDDDEHDDQDQEPSRHVFHLRQELAQSELSVKPTAPAMRLLLAFLYGDCG